MFNLIIDSDYQTLTVKTDKGQILIRNIDEYNLLKYDDFKEKEESLEILSDIKSRIDSENKVPVYLWKALFNSLDLDKDLLAKAKEVQSLHNKNN